MMGMGRVIEPDHTHPTWWSWVWPFSNSKSCSEKNIIIEKTQEDLKKNDK